VLCSGVQFGQFIRRPISGPMRHGGQLDALLLAWVVTSVSAVRSRAFLAQPEESQSDLVATKLSVIEDDWQAQVSLFAQCEQGDKQANRESCNKIEGLFTQSCTAISTAFVSGQGGDSRAVTSFMDGVCAGKALDALRRDTCLSFRGELLAAIATSQDAKLNAMGLCQHLWARLIDREQLRGEDSQKDREVKVLTQELAEARVHAAKAAEEQRQKDDAEAKKLEARAMELQAEAMRKAQQQQQEQQLTAEKGKHQLAEEQRQREATAQQEKAALEKQREDMAAKQEKAAETQRQEVEKQHKQVEEQRMEAAAKQGKLEEAMEKQKVLEAAAEHQKKEQQEAVEDKQEALEHQKEQQQTVAEPKKQEVVVQKQDKKGAGAVSTAPPVQQEVQQQAKAKTTADQTLQAGSQKALPTVTQDADSKGNKTLHHVHWLVSNKTRKFGHQKSMYNRWQKLKALKMAKLKKLKQRKHKNNVSAVLKASEEKRKLAELRAAAAQAALEKAMHVEDKVKADTAILRKKRIIQEIEDRKQLAREVRERRAKKLKEAKLRHEKAERDRLAYEADLKKRQESKVAYPLTKSLVNATSWQRHPRPQVVHPAAPATVPHVSAHSLEVANHTPVSEGAGAAASRRSVKENHNTEKHEEAARTATKKGLSTKVAETKRQAAAPAAATAATEATEAETARAHNAEGKRSLKTDSGTAAPQKVAPLHQEVPAWKVVPAKATVNQQGAKQLADPPKATAAQQSHPKNSTSKRSPPPVKVLHQAASAVKVATETKKSEKVEQSSATELGEAGTDKETEGEEKQKASEAVTAGAQKKEQEVVKLADEAESDEQGSDEVADNDSQDGSQDKQESQSKDGGEDKEESQDQDDSEEDTDKGSDEKDSEQNESNNEKEDTASAPANDDN